MLQLVITRGVMVHVFSKIFGMGLSVRYACVQNKSFHFFQEIQTIHAVLALFDVARQIAV